MNYEIIGLIATSFVLVSFLFNGEKMIRSINIVGSIIFTVYGILIIAPSVWILNGVLFFVHIYKLIQMSRKEKLKDSEIWQSLHVNNKEVQIKK